MKKIFSMLFVGLIALSACTDKFNDYNINQHEATPDQMLQDNLNIGAYFSQMQKGVFVLGVDKGGEYQLTEMLEGDLYASYFAATMVWSNAGQGHDRYALYDAWYNAPFNDAYTDIMQPWKSITDQVSENSPARAMANIIKVLGMQRITDMYGPIIYTQFGKGVQVAYDSQKDVYYQFFEELDEAIQNLTEYVNAGNTTYLANYDYVFSGNVKKWVKLANTLRLRCAMRISYVDEAKAREEAAAAINHEIGLMVSADDAAAVHQNPKFTFKNPLWEVSESFQDEHMSATMDCYLNGYADPRIGVYFRRAANDGQYHGIQNGTNPANKDAYVAATSGVNFESNSDMPWMDAAEAYFLLAEAKLRFDLGTESVQSYYEQGIQTSFATKGAANAASYIANNTNLPLTAFVDATNSRSTNVSLSNVTVKWDDAATADVKLERIMVQKWIALYPNGQEAWSEVRRTGYPKLVPLANYTSQNEGVANGEVLSRLRFPSTEYANNSANTAAAVGLLGGADRGSTRLWWDVKR